MKTKSLLRSRLALCASAILVSASAHADTLYWDGNDTNANANGGAGTWTTGGTNWDDLAFGGANTAWASGDLAVFGATNGTVTIGTGGVTVGGLTFITTNTTAYTLAAGTNGLNFSSGTNNITFAIHNGNAAANITGTVGGTGADLVLGTQNLTRTSTLTFSGISSAGWTGTTTIGQNTTLTTTTTSGNINRVLDSTSGITLNGGAIQFNRATNAQLSAISDSAAITVNGGGTFGATSADAGGASANETIGAVTLNSGQFNLNWTNNPSSGGNIILSGLTRSVDTSALTVSFGANGRFRNAAVATDTAADEIIGAWATTGGQNGIGAQTDYAVYSGGNGTITARGIAASAESTWSTVHAATSNFTMSAIDSGTITGGGRNVNTLRSLNNSVTATSGNPDITLTGHTLAVGDIVTFSGTTPGGLTAGTAYYVVSAGTNTIQVSATKGGTAITPSSAGSSVVAAGGIQVSSGNNLGTFGILNGSATTLNILQDGGAGNITLPTTAAGNLFVTAGSGAITIAAPIVNNTGALTLVKGGTSTLTLSGTNTYTGGTVLNAGTLAIGNVNHIGGAGASLTINGTATLAPSAALNFSSGTLTVNQGALATIANTNSVTFATTTGAGTLTFSGSVAHNIGNASGLTGTLALLQASGTQSVQFSSLNGNTTGSMLAFGGNANDSNQRSHFIFNGSSPLTFAASGRQVAITPSTNSNGGARWNVLENNSGSAANTWVINSDLINTGVRGGISLVLAGSNTGNNAFNGVIGNNTLNNGSLWVAKNGGGKWILGGNNTFTGRLVVSQGTLSVDTFNNADTAGPLGQGQIQLGGTTRADGANGNGPFGDNSGTLQYTGGAVTTTRTVIIGDNQAGNTGGGTIANDGTGAMTFNAANFNNSAGAITSTTRTLTLAGTYTGGANEIQGVISNGTSSTGRLNVAKSGNATWLLSGANTYTGTTSVTGGNLIARNATALGSGTTANVSVTNAALNYYAATDTALNIGGTLSLAGGANAVIGGSIGSTTTSARINVAGNATSTATAFKVNIYGNSFSATTDGDGTYTLVQGGGTNTLNNATYTLGTVYNNTNFTVGALGKTANNVTVDITTATALTAAYWTGGLSGNTNVWSASDGSTASNWVTAAGGGATALVPGSGADVFISANSVATAPTSTVLGADMSINSLTISDTANGLGLNADGYKLTIGTGGITMDASVPASTIGASVVLGGNQTWTNNSANALTVSGVVNGGNTLEKAGTGTLVLGGANTYTGATTVSAGTMLVNGSTAAASTVTVDSGATLGGTGTVGGNATVDGMVAPGAAGIGTLKVGGAVTWNAGDSWEFDLGSTGTTSDRLAITGAFTKGSGTGFVFDFMNSQPEWGKTFTLLTFASTNFVVGDLDLAGSIATLGAGSYSTSSFNFTSTSLTFTAIPEPSTALGGLLLTAGLLRRRRKQAEV